MNINTGCYYAAINDLKDAVEDECRRSLGALPEVFVECSREKVWTGKQSYIYLYMFRVYDASFGQRIA